ncbi:hypothetical protein BDN71DRAFT_1435910 [Pleurotus eryngii]|uniref:Uncharacterized protein n=1 Tax=Pleurotus eryngii TaxID=5323 RepID=A0A9P5ZN05_PLEER|nr:hypothetical protein BDN71DRAFT_1435910 [Pleurotus eryngii]
MPALCLGLIGHFVAGGWHFMFANSHVVALQLGLVASSLYAGLDLVASLLHAGSNHLYLTWVYSSFRATLPSVKAIMDACGCLRACQPCQSPEVTQHFTSLRGGGGGYFVYIFGDWALPVFKPQERAVLTTMGLCLAPYASNDLSGRADVLHITYVEVDWPTSQLLYGGVFHFVSGSGCFCWGFDGLEGKFLALNIEGKGLAMQEEAPQFWGDIPRNVCKGKGEVGLSRGFELIGWGGHHDCLAADSLQAPNEAALIVMVQEPTPHSNTALANLSHALAQLQVPPPMMTSAWLATLTEPLCWSTCSMSQTPAPDDSKAAKQGATSGAVTNTNHMWEGDPVHYIILNYVHNCLVFPLLNSGLVSLRDIQAENSA